MRYITLGGNRYPIHCSVTVDEAVNKRFAAYRQKMVEQAEADVEARGLQGGEAEEYKAVSLKSATLAYLTDAENDLYQFALLINAGVRYESIINRHDIANEVVGYPLDAEKLAMIATVQDLNSPETVDAVAAEFARCRGGDEKNGTAGELTKTAMTILQTLSK